MCKASRLNYVLACLLLSTSPLYADTPWNGAYIGANIGASLADADFSAAGSNPTSFIGVSIFNAIVASANGDFSDALISGGGQLGFNVQQGGWIFGLEADFNALQLDEQRTYSGADSAFTWVGGDRVSADWLVTARARAGILATPALLFYGTAGVAFTQIKQDSTLDFAGSSVISHRVGGEESKAGWAAGAGAEYSLGGSWSLKAEYLYVHFSDVSATATIDPPPLPTTITHSVDDLSLHNLRVGLNYGF